MRQVLFEIPIEGLNKALPDLPLLYYVGAAVLFYGLGIIWQKRRGADAPQSGINVRAISSAIAVLLVIAAVVKLVSASTGSIPIYGYGMMLFVAFVLCAALAWWLAEREGMHINVMDMILWIFVFGIIGGRITFMIQYQLPLWEFPMIWMGGLVFYGAAFGGVIGYFVAYFAFLKKQGASTWKMMDVAAPCAALGLALGRVGCLLNGCCYGDVACDDCPAITFPVSSPPRVHMVSEGYQTAAGFTLTPSRVPTVAKVDPDSLAADAGLKPGDVIKRVNEQPVDTDDDLDKRFTSTELRGKSEIRLVVQRGEQIIPLPAFAPRTIGLHPTQVYETISMILLLVALLAYFPLRRHEGAVMVAFMFGYAAHRFLNEMLRTDTKPVAFSMTLSQNISIIVAVCGVLLFLVVKARPARVAPG